MSAARPFGVVVADEVRRELSGRARVVALETTLISHGLPHPRNLMLARAVEAAVREAGAVPATIGVVEGRIKVGLDDADLVRLAEGAKGGGNVVKASTRDLALVAARGLTAGTTVAATIHLAAASGIRVMATVGIGGVHPGGEASLDVSADLDALARTPCAVVCAGPKAILDLPRTLEALETRGVLVAGYGTDRLPGFYVRETPLSVPMLDGIEAAERLLQAQEALGWPAGIVIANPPPGDLALEPDAFGAMLDAALEAAGAEGVQGSGLTPFLLRHLAAASGGRTVRLNEALVLANARLAARLAAYRG